MLKQLLQAVIVVAVFGLGLVLLGPGPTVLIGLVIAIMRRVRRSTSAGDSPDRA